jgi:hypothetical protein
MNVNDLVEAFGLPRYYAEKLPAGASLVATVNADGSVAVEVHPPGYDPLAAPPVVVINELGHVVGVKIHEKPRPFDLRQEAKDGLAALDVQVAIKRGPGRPRKIVSE